MSSENLDSRQVLSRSISCLRKIRASIFPGERTPLPYVTPQEALRDAKVLGEGTAQCLVDPLVGLPSQPSFDILDSLEIKYLGYSELTAKSWLIPVSHLQTLLDGFERIAWTGIEPSPAVLGALLGMHNLRGAPPTAFLQPGVGVLAPLSSDFLGASLIRRFMTECTDIQPFVLQPVILSKDLAVDKNQGTGQYDETFDRVTDKIAIFTDVDINKDTRNAAVQTARNIYPHKPIHGYSPAVEAPGVRLFKRLLEWF